MTRTYKSLVDAVIEHQLNPNKYTTSVKRWLNEGQDKLAERIDFRALFTSIDFETEVGEPAYTLPDDFLRLIVDEDVNSVANATDPNNWLPIGQMTLREFDDLSTDTPATPTLYAIAGNVLYLYPTPDAVYDIALIYYRRPLAMENDSDTPEIPDHFADVLELYALLRAFERENDYQAAAYWQGRYDAELLKAMGQANVDTRDAPKLVAGTWGRHGVGSVGSTSSGGTSSDTGGGDTFGEGTFG